MKAVEPPHAGEQLQARRERAGMSVEELAERAGVSAAWLAALEQGVGTADVPYATWLTLVRATQPPRPDWWDEGYEHDLTLGPDGHEPPKTEREREYWRRVESVRAQIRDHYRRGRRASA